jgi:hypothetical protein
MSVFRISMRRVVARQIAVWRVRKCAYAVSNATDQPVHTGHHVVEMELGVYQVGS